MACRFLFILVQDNQLGDDARYLVAEREQKHDEHRPAAAFDHRQGRKEDGQVGLEAGHIMNNLGHKRPLKTMKI